MKSVWITWEKQLRNRSMAGGIGAELHEILVRGGRTKRYLISSLKTVSVLCGRMPEVVFVQNPSIFLCLLVLHIKWIFGFKVIIDAHFGGVEAFNGSAIFQWVIDYCNRNADMVIVTNPAHGKKVASLGGRPVVCPDPLPNLERYKQSGKNTEKDKSVLFICSFDVDEPYREVLYAYEILKDEGFRCVISGNYRKVGLVPDQHPFVVFTGFVSEELFYRNLFESAVVVDLTTWENCLVCGAYEAMSAEVPLVVSNRKSIREYFDQGVVYTDHDPTSIAAAIRAAFADKERLIEEIRAWKIEKSRENRKTLDEIVNNIRSSMN